MITKICDGCHEEFTVFPCFSHYRHCSKACQDNVDSKWMPEPNSGCWLWLKSVNPYGYGILNRDGHRLAHRFLYERAKGPIPEGMQLDHKCRVRSCVNPAHLEPVTNQENARRGIRRTTAIAALVCVNGHRWNERNTYTRSTGQRVCRDCANESRRGA